jgi:hypothetical protein
MNIFHQKTGLIDLSNGEHSQGYAGHGEGKNNPEMENVRGVGPLPHGIYVAVSMFHHHPDLGAYAMLLQPDEETKARIIALGRDPGSFFCHGDSYMHPGDASDGCIILDRVTRLWIWNNDHAIKVIPGDLVQ